MTTATTASRNQEIHPMTLVDCPLCDAPAPFDADADALDCPSCAVHLELAAEKPRALPAAA